MEVNMKINSLNLKVYYTFGLSLLQLMAVIAVLGLVAAGVYELCSGGTAG
jgi:hypothetical protein